MSETATVKHFNIIDADTGKRVTIVSFLNRSQAEQQIAQWQDRHEQGGRPDITREMLLRMRVEQHAAAYDD